MKTAPQTILLFTIFSLLFACSEAGQHEESILDTTDFEEVDSLQSTGDSLQQDAPIPIEEDYTATDITELGAELMERSAIGGVKMGMSEEEVIAAVGEPDSKSPTEFWEVDGTDHTFWFYADSSFIIEFSDYDQEDGDEVVILDLVAESPYQMERGISVGSSLELVKERFVKAIALSDWKEGDAQIQLGDAGYGGLFIDICDGIICSIRIGAVIRC